MRCEQVFRQVCWLAERFWPEVDGMGEEDNSLMDQTNGSVVQAAQAANQVVQDGSFVGLNGGNANAGPGAPS